MKNIKITILVYLLFSCQKEEFPIPTSEIINSICFGKGWDEANLYNPNINGIHPLIYSISKFGDFNKDVLNPPNSWRPKNINLAELMVCGSSFRETIDFCSYTNGKSYNTFRFGVNLILKVAKTGEIISSKSFTGDYPTGCRREINEDFNPSDVYGDIAEMQSMINDWLKAFVVK